MAWRLGGDLVASPQRLLETGRVSGEWREIQTSSILFFFFFYFFQSPACLGDISATSPRPAGDQGDWGDVAATSPLETGKSLFFYLTCLNFPQLPGDPASLQETSRRRLRNQQRLESPPSLQANEIGPQLPETSPQLRRCLRDVAAMSPWLPGKLVVTSGDASRRRRLGESASHFLVSQVAATDRGIISTNKQDIINQTT